ncbi:hypothetical protein ABZ719_29405 [Streptomyces sp. NPDC006743]|uniref:hypothetical protein n=1 Tax=Streptomyces sp. NPDC006743 TaxID=3154480 RepID=UPI003453893B
MADVPQSDEEEIASHFRGGHILFASMGVVDDVLGSGASIIGGGSLLTDGEWRWRGDLWFYARWHHVVPPDEFRAKAETAGYTVPPVEQERLVVLADEVQELRSCKQK